MLWAKQPSGECGPRNSVGDDSLETFRDAGEEADWAPCSRRGLVSLPRLDYHSDFREFPWGREVLQGKATVEQTEVHNTR